MAVKGALRMYRGDTTVFTFTGTNTQSGGALDITGATAWFTGKRNESDTDAQAQFQKTTANGIVLTDPTNGVATITMAAADTSALTGTTSLYYDFQIVDALGAVQTLAKGILTVLVDITVATEIP